MSSIALMLCLLMAASSVYADTSIINVYDANGNLVTGDGRYYEYNDANQLVQVRQGDTIAGPIIAEYFYDASGQRVKKIENGVVTYYVGKHFEKQVGGANAGDTSYYFGDDGERVAKKDPAGNVYYYHLDHLDGINAVTDSSGTVVAKTDYLPFGELRNGSSGTEKYSYTGKEKDKTDLYYFDARYNSPEFRHFTQADIAEPDYDDPQDLNRYSYVGNNPLSYVDYDGFKKKKKKHLSKREQRARSLGLNPDKDKYKVGKWSHKEYKHALESKHNADRHRAAAVVNYLGATAPNSQITAKNVANKKSNFANWQQTQLYREEADAWNEEARNWKGLDAVFDATPFVGDIKSGLVWQYEFHKFYFENAVGRATNGKYGKTHTFSDQIKLYQEMPYVGFVLKSAERQGAQILGMETSITEEELAEDAPFVGDAYRILKWANGH